MNKGRFITIDGVEGAGKSTQIDLICSYLQRKGIEKHKENIKRYLNNN
jgi:dTMP kinase